jgi:uncharacterized protein (TIGR02268 family)
LIQPLRLALALALLWGTAARAGGRIERTRAVTVTGTPDGPLPEIHVTGDTPTVLFFRAPIQKKTLTFDESRIRLLDAGDLSVIVQAVTDLKEGERHEIGVFFADGRVPARAAFVLVNDPSEVDIRIDVQRPEPPPVPCSNEAQPRATQPEDFVLLGYVGKEGVSVTPIKDVDVADLGLSTMNSYSYRGQGWALVAVEINNHSVQAAWIPREATLTGPPGLVWRTRLVMKDKSEISPGMDERVLAVVDTPDLNAATVFTLELRGEDGRSFKIPNVRFPKAVMEEIR